MYTKLHVKKDGNMVEVLNKNKSSVEVYSKNKLVNKNNIKRKEISSMYIKIDFDYEKRVRDILDREGVVYEVLQSGVACYCVEEIDSVINEIADESGEDIFLKDNHSEARDKVISLVSNSDDMLDKDEIRTLVYKIFREFDIIE